VSSTRVRELDMCMYVDQEQISMIWLGVIVGALYVVGDQSKEGVGLKLEGLKAVQGFGNTSHDLR
jgi:hypothetical protein